METYREMKQRHQEEVNALPLGFAFNRDQFRDQLAKWGITEEEAKAGAVVSIGAGGFIRATDRELVIDTFRRHKREKQAAFDADTTGTGYIYEMFYCELCNHEYSYTGSISDTLEALGLTRDEVNASEALKAGLLKAVREIAGEADVLDE